MTGPGGSLQVQQLLELLAVVSSFPDEASAVHGAVERAAQALEAEVAAVVVDGRVAAAIGFPDGAVPAADLVAVARRERDRIDVPGLGRCDAIAAGWGGSHPGHLVIARWDGPFTVEERNLVRGMARLLELALTMLRTLQAEHAMRERGERQARENAELLESLRQRQRLLQHLFEIQRAISRREPLQQILETITAAAQDLLGDDIVGLWLRDQQDPERARLSASVGLRLARHLPAVALGEAGAAGAAIRTDRVVLLHGYAQASPVISDVTGGRLCASMAAPVHESGAVTGALLVASYQPGRRYLPADEQTLTAFAEHVSLALTDAHTVLKMNQAFHDALTGLASRGLFLERMTHQLRGGDRVGLLFIDLDRFKSVNDTLGHAAGDQLLMSTAERIKAAVRPVDVAARFGGDEFAVMLCGLSDAGDAAAVAERITAALNEPMVVAGQHLCVGASIGIALSRPGLQEPAELMRHADIAMYQAKRNGRGRYELFTDAMLRAFTEGRSPTAVAGSPAARTAGTG